MNTFTFLLVISEGIFVGVHGKEDYGKHAISVLLRTSD